MSDPLSELEKFQIDDRIRSQINHVVIMALACDQLGEDVATRLHNNTIDVCIEATPNDRIREFLMKRKVQE